MQGEITGGYMKNYVRVSDILARLQNFGSIDHDVLAAKAQIGTNVHESIQKYILKQPYEHKCDRERAYFNSFLQWYEKADPKYLVMEARLFDDNLMITGQMDAIIDSADGPILIDYKTSAKANEKIWNMQAHFYWYLVSANKIEIGTKMRWINLRHKKVNLVNNDGQPIMDGFTGMNIMTYEAVAPKVYEFTFSQKVLQECIDEANKYWEDKANNFDID
jgi:hypothetical protein